MKMLVKQELSAHSACFGVKEWVLRCGIGGIPGTDVFGQLVWAEV